MFVLNTVDGCIPSDLGVGTTAEIEEERRLLYVAMTRAKDHLHLIVPQRTGAWMKSHVVTDRELVGHRWHELMARVLAHGRHNSFVECSLSDQATHMNCRGGIFREHLSTQHLKVCRRHWIWHSILSRFITLIAFTPL